MSVWFLCAYNQQEVNYMALDFDKMKERLDALLSAQRHGQMRGAL